MSPLDGSQRSQTSAQRYIQENFEPEDWLAAVVRNRRTEETVQRITTARQIASPEFQAWLRHKNAQGSDIYLSLNTLREHSSGRTKADLKDIRHLYLDLDEEGKRKLAKIYEDARVPHPNYVLQTSPGKYQVVWRVESIARKVAEDLLRSLARRFGGDPAATDSTRVFRLPGFHNKKYLQNFPVKLMAGTFPEPIYHRADFRIEPVPAEPGNHGRAFISVSTPVGAGAELPKTQSERDWAYAVRRLHSGDDPEEVIRKIATYRAADRFDPLDATRRVSSRKPNPRYYAERTVSRAKMYIHRNKAENAKGNSSPEVELDR